MLKSFKSNAFLMLPYCMMYMYLRGDKMKLVLKNHVRRPGVEPGSTAWKATMLTVTPPTLLHRDHFNSQTGLHSVFNVDKLRCNIQYEISYARKCAVSVAQSVSAFGC